MQLQSTLACPQCGHQSVETMASDKIARSTYGNVAEQFVIEPLTENVWKNRLGE
jgi:hypothetical protein